MNLTHTALQIYGEDEKIYGYKNLVIDVSPQSILFSFATLTCSLIQLRFTSGSLHQYLNVSYASKLASSSTVDNVEATLSEFIPPGVAHLSLSLDPPSEISQAMKRIARRFRISWNVRRQNLSP